MSCLKVASKAGMKTILDLGLPFTCKNGDFCAISVIKWSEAVMHQPFKWRVIHVYWKK